MVDLLLLLLVLFLDLFLAPSLDQLILLHELSLIITSGLSHDCLKLHLTLWVQQFLLSISLRPLMKFDNISTLMTPWSGTKMNLLLSRWPFARTRLIFPCVPSSALLFSLMNSSHVA